MPVILRWLLMDLAVSRVLRRYRARRYGMVGGPELMGRYPRRYRLPAALVFRRPLLACGSGCAAMLAMSLLASLLLTGLANLLFR
ncbi:MAG: hypothetical protein ABR541_08940 [Candidatus Dormibacteria bacterium]